MVLEISNGLFGQEDVRETPSTNLLQANFDSNDFDVTDGFVSLKNKTSYWSCTGKSFVPKESASDSLYIKGDDTALLEVGLGTGTVNATTSCLFSKSVDLPQGAIITGVVVYGTDAAETWTLRRIVLGTPLTTVDMATASINTEDTSITSATIDNSSYCYELATSSFETADDLIAARIKYTTDYI